MMRDDEALKVFHLNRSLALAELARLERDLGHDVLPRAAAMEDRDNEFYPQFPAALREAAKGMAEHYEIFYCLENFIRDLVSDQLRSLFGDDWWTSKVPEAVRAKAADNMMRERDAGVTPRSTEPIDYTTFGELSTIIDSNWASFGDIFNSRKGLIAILSRLNMLRGPIAHCSELSEDEVMRLRLSLADWFRLMA